MSGDIVKPRNPGKGSDHAYVLCHDQGQVIAPSIAGSKKSALVILLLD